MMRHTWQDHPSLRGVQHCPHCTLQRRRTSALANNPSGNGFAYRYPPAPWTGNYVHCTRPVTQHHIDWHRRDKSAAAKRREARRGVT
jgi:hypothetical protein